MKLSKLSTFPLHKPFERQDASTNLSEVALRLVVNFYSESPRVVGTAVAVAGHLLVSAKHVLEVDWEQSSGADASPPELDDHLVAVQILAGPEYVVWDVVGGWADPMSDIILLHLGAAPRRSNFQTAHRWVHPRLNPFAPAVGERVAAFGYRKSTINVSKNPDGSNYIALDDEPIVSVGVVRAIYDLKRDAFNLSFPCYQVSARFDAGMSGGPVFDETGCLCGIVCSNIDGSHLNGEPVSYVTTLWPLFRLIISADRGDRYPRGIQYPAIELARDGQIAVPDIERLTRLFQNVE